MEVTKSRSWCLALSIVFTLFATGCGDPLADCNPYAEYDDAFSGRIFERATTLSAKDIRELRLYSFDRDLGLPCQKVRHFLYHLRTIREEEELVAYLSSVNLTNEIECHTAPSPPFWKSLGMEFVAQDGRKTFITIWIYKDSIDEWPFPLKKYEYNKWGFCNDVLYALLKERGVLDAMPGYGEFMAAQKQNP